jgi:hypothetical protein
LFRFLPDYKAAAALAVGGPVQYVIRQGSGITDGWILQNVVPKKGQYPYRSKYAIMAVG